MLLSSFTQTASFPSFPALTLLGSCSSQRYGRAKSGVFLWVSRVCRNYSALKLQAQSPRHLSQHFVLLPKWVRAILAPRYLHSSHTFLITEVPGARPPLSTVLPISVLVRPVIRPLLQQPFNAQRVMTPRSCPDSCDLKALSAPASEPSSFSFQQSFTRLLLALKYALHAMQHLQSQ